MIIKRLINQSIQNQALNSDDVKKCMNACLKGGATPAQISSFFTSGISVLFLTMITMDVSRSGAENRS